MKALYPYIFEEVDKSGMVKAATILDGEYAGSKTAWLPDGKSGAGTRFYGPAGAEIWEQAFDQLRAEPVGCRIINGTTFFIETFMKRPRLVVLGGGHIAGPVCELGRMLDFDVTVIDDRPEFANAERFAHADAVMCFDYGELSERLPDLPNTYYVIVTRGHIGDEICVSELLKRSCPYIGMIGSRAKVDSVFGKLRDLGFSEEDIKRIHAPIGLKIGAQTPAEIAVSIMGEIIQVKNQSPVMTIDSAVGEKLRREDITGTMVTIIKKSGSAPRGTGSRMLVYGRGTCGSVGGGAVEHQAVLEAGKIKRAKIETYDLSDRESASLGMVCGGEVTLFYEPL